MKGRCVRPQRNIVTATLLGYALTKSFRARIVRKRVAANSEAGHSISERRPVNGEEYLLTKSVVNI